MKKYKKLANTRNKNKYTLVMLASYLGVSNQFVWDLEDGRRNLSYKTAFKIAKLFETTTDELFLEDYKKKQ